MKFLKKLKTILKRSYAKTVIVGFGAFFIGKEGRPIYVRTIRFRIRDLCQRS